MTIKKLVYASRRLATCNDETLQTILKTSRILNRRDGITGILLHDDRRFVQLLEGEHDAIARCFLRISMNPHHSEIEIAAFGDSAVRLLVDWDMHDVALTDAMPKLGTLWRTLMAAPPEVRLMNFEEKLFRFLPRG
jgi:hypothetical protein